jgi:hypothetical protein
METDYLAYFEEFALPIVFTFFMSERYEAEFDGDFPVLTGTYLALDCKFTIGGYEHSYGNYEERLTKLSTSGLQGVEHFANTNQNNKIFLKKIKEKIQSSLNMFDFKGDLLIRSNCKYVSKVDQKFLPKPLSQEKVIEDPYYKLINPFIHLQWQNLRDFDDRFSGMFSTELSKENMPRKGSIMFKYNELYVGHRTKRQVREYIEEMRKELFDKGIILNKGINPFLKYLGLIKDGSKIEWLNAGDFFTFNLYMQKNKVLRGHNWRTLKECFIVQGWDNWELKRSLKPTQNETSIIKVVNKFRVKLESLKNRSSSSDSAL